MYLRYQHRNGKFLVNMDKVEWLRLTGSTIDICCGESKGSITFADDELAENALKEIETAVCSDNISLIVVDYDEITQVSEKVHTEVKEQ